MRVKRATSLVIEHRDDRLLVNNFLAKRQFLCNTDCVAFLGRLSEWTDLDSLFAANTGLRADQLAEQIETLITERAILVEGTSEAARDREYAESWEWGASSGLYHFSIRNSPFLSGPEQREAIRDRRERKGPSPALIQPNPEGSSAIRLPAPANGGLFTTIRQRRSIRAYREMSVSLQALTDCLFAGKGITGQIRDEDFGLLPLGTTPSGGARNPYELYLYARKVAGLNPGWYHYSGAQNSLTSVNRDAVCEPEMLGGQQWTQDAAAIVFLVADFARSRWKYHTPPSYRVVLMEAGFIGQNIALAASHHGLSATPTGALQEDRLEEILGCPRLDQSVILALVIGHPDKTRIPEIEPVDLDELTGSNND